MTTTYTMTVPGNIFAGKRATATDTLAKVKEVKAAQRIAGDQMIVAELERYDAFEGSKSEALAVMASRSSWAASTIKQRITDGRKVMDFFGCTAEELIATIGADGTVSINGNDVPASLQGLKKAILAVDVTDDDGDDGDTEESGTAEASVDAAAMLLKLAADMSSIRQAVVDGQFASDETLRDAVIAMEVERESLTLALNHALRKINRVAR